MRRKKLTSSSWSLGIVRKRAFRGLKFIILLIRMVAPSTRNSALHAQLLGNGSSRRYYG